MLIETPTHIDALMAAIHRARINHLRATFHALRGRIPREIIRVVYTFILPSSSVRPYDQWVCARGNISISKRGLYRHIEGRHDLVQSMPKWTQMNQPTVHRYDELYKEVFARVVFEEINRRHQRIVLDHIKWYGPQALLVDLCGRRRRRSLLRPLLAIHPPLHM